MSQAYDNLIKLATKEKFKSSPDFLRFKKQVSGKLGIQPPTNADLREAYETMLNNKKIKRNLNLESMLFSKKIRTASGVAVVAVLTKPYPCPGKCLYCPDETGMPKSYLSNEPAVMRAIASKFNPRSQVQKRLRALWLNGHSIDKIELIVMGGTFSYFPKKYQTWFVKECFRACNEYKKCHPEFDSGSQRFRIKSGMTILEKEQKKNEKAKVRIVGLTLETRPDYIDEKEVLNFRRLGATRVELGVQSIFDSVLKKNHRGHNVKKTIEATRLLKEAGFKINYHLMPGLLGSTITKDKEMFKQIFSDPDFQPDMIKIYPTIVNKKSDLFKFWQQGKYIPLNNKSFEKLILEIKNEIIPPYVRIQRLIRDVPESEIVAGPNISNLRQLLKTNCQCIRCREVKTNFDPKEKIILDRIDYVASGGKEIFLQFVSSDKQKLLALLRLRIPGEKNHFIPTLQNSALIREVHTYGQLVKIDKKDKKLTQHQGLGKKLIKEAEKIAKKEFNLDKISVISGVGVRGYYRKLGYRLQKTYMLKYL